MPPVIDDRGEDCESQIHDTAHAYNKGCRCPRAIADKARLRHISERRQANGNGVRRLSRIPIRPLFVKALLNGRQPIGVTQAETAEAIERLYRGGSGASAIALIIGSVTLRTVQRHLRRLRDEERDMYRG